MSYEQEAIGQLFSLTVGGTMFAVQLTTALTKELYHFFKKAVQEGAGPISRHRLTMHEFLKRSNGVEVFAIKEEDWKIFRAAAKKSPMYYYAGCLDVTAPKGERVITVCVSPADVPIVNQIIELNHLNVVPVGSAKVSTAEAGQEIPPMPDMDDVPEEEEGSWWDFVGPEGEYGTPDENKAKREAAEKAVPTQPESDTKSASPSATSSGSSRGKGSASQNGQTSRQAKPQITALLSAGTGATDLIAGDGFVIYPDVTLITAIRCVTEHKEASVEMLQRELHIDMGLAERLMNDLEAKGVINSQKEVMMSYDDYLAKEIDKFHGNHAAPAEEKSSAETSRNPATSGRKPIREQLDEVKSVRDAKQPLSVEVIPVPQAAHPLTQ